MGVKLKVVHVGNSQGIRIPKPLLAQCGIQNEVEAEVVEGAIILRPVGKALRVGWEKAFSEMSQQGDDQVNFEGSNAFDESDWEWK